jgi:hypothetical protein
MVFSKGKFMKGDSNYSFWNCFLLGSLFLVIALSLVQINAGISYSLEINQLEKKHQELKTENEKLLEEKASLESMDSLQEISQNLNMVEISQVNYLRLGLDTLAQAQRPR